MCIEVAHVARLAVLESENDAPVAGNIHGPETSKITFQSVQSPARDVHILRLGRYVEVSQDALYSTKVIGVDAASISVLIQTLQGPGPSYKQTLAKVLRGTSDANIRFGHLRTLLAALGFEERIKGSHHIFTLEGREAALNLQPDGSKAKAYQVRRVRHIIIEHRLASDEEDE